MGVKEDHVAVLEAQFKHDPIELRDFLIEPAIRSEENRVKYKGSIWVPAAAITKTPCDQVS